MDNELFKALFRLGWRIVEQHKKLLQFNGDGPPRRYVHGHALDRGRAAVSHVDA